VGEAGGLWGPRRGLSEASVAIRESGDSDAYSLLRELRL
jgi:hypothetical protein